MHIAECGHEVPRADTKTCRECWRKRGPDIPDKTPRIGECGHPVSGTVAKLCRECYQKRGREQFVLSDLPDHEEPISELLERRAQSFDRKHTAEVARRMIPVRINTDGPIGLALGGDPHLDDDGTDIRLVQRDLALINNTEGLYGANVGDYNNNWDGRLAKLYAEQSTSAEDAWRLVDWFIREVPWLFLIKGNHDAWSQSRDPIQRTADELGIYYDYQARFDLKLPSGRSVIVNARHDYRGHSQWNPAHGPAKAIQMGWRDHIAVAGHLHISGYGPYRDPASRRISHALRVASYKVHDRYAKQNNFPDQAIMICPVAIIDPRFQDDDPRFITVILDTEEGAEYLTWKRQKWARGSSAA